MIVAPLARGGVEPWAVAAAAALALTAAAWARAHRSVPPAAVPMLAALALMLFQLVPAPPWLHPLSPGARSLFESALAPLGLYPSWRPFSLAPGEGLRTLAPAVAAVAALLAARAVAENGAGRRRLAQAVALSGVIAAAAVLAVALAGLGPYVEPRFPFVNPNHLAALTGLGAVTALGIAFGEVGTTRLLWLAGCGLTAAVTLLTLSRSGLVALCAGAVVLLVLHRRAPGEAPERGPPRGPAQRVAPFVAGAAGLVLAVTLLAYEPLSGELRSVGAFAGDAKPRLWLAGLTMLWPHALLGMGKGAFATVSSSYWLEPSLFTYTHVENTWLQLLLDLGVPCGLALVAAFAWIWREAAKDAKRGSSDVALLAGLASLFVHDLADFSLETCGVAIPAAVALGLLARRLPSFPVPAWAGWSTALLLALSAVGGVALHEVVVAPAQQAVLSAGSEDALQRRAARALRLAPADYVIPANVGAALEARGRCAPAMAWLSVATSLDPSAPEPHLLLARCLRAGGQTELARQESVLAIALGDPRGYSEAIAAYPSLDDLVRAVPATPDHLLALARELAATRPDDAAAVLRRLADEYLDDRALLPLVRASLSRRRPGEALELARRAQRVRRPTPEAWYLGYVALVEQGDLDASLAELRAGVARFPGAGQLLVPLAERTAALRRFGEARRLAEEIAPATAAEAGGKYLLLARVYAAQGRYSEALHEDRAAVAAMPGSPTPLLQLASHALAAGRLADAVAALEAACPMRGLDQGLCARQLAEARRRAAEEQEAAGRPAADPAGDPR